MALVKRNLRNRRVNTGSIVALPFAFFATCVITLSTSDAGEVSPDNPFYARLTAPFVSVIEGQEFRTALHDIAGQAGVNLWIDRHANPNQIVDVGQTGPTVFAAIESVALANDCVAMPIHSTVVVGREAWVLRTCASLMTSEQNATPSSAVNLAWPDATEPAEVWSLILRASRGTASRIPGTLSFPHDLLAGNVVKEIRIDDVVTLMLAQFDMQLNESGQVVGVTKSSHPRGQTRVLCTYRVPDAVALRQTIESRDRRAVIKSTRAGLAVTTSVANHRLAIANFCRAKLPAGGQQPAAGPAPPDATFDFKIVNKPGGVVLKQLVSASGRTLTIAPSATEACEGLISLDAKGRTLKQLCEAVAEKIGIEMDWQPKAVVIK